MGWEDGAKAPYYTQAAANIRVVARQINLLLDLINSNHSPSDFDIHCIGHSLGEIKKNFAFSFFFKFDCFKKMG